MGLKSLPTAADVLNSVLTDLCSGNIIIIGSATSCIIALTWAGVTLSWSSAQVIAPLIVGIAGLALALVYDAFVAPFPVVRWQSKGL